MVSRIYNQHVSCWIGIHHEIWGKLVMQVQEVGVEAAPQNRNLYVTVNTYGPDGKQIGTRVVDMYHYGTRNWLANHTWWAMHNGHVVEQMPATDAEIDDYLEAAKKALAQKFANGVVA